MRYIYLGILLLLNLFLVSCFDTSNDTQKENTQTGAQTQFDSPNLLDLDSNTSLPEKSLGDD